MAGRSFLHLFTSGSINCIKRVVPEVVMKKWGRAVGAAVAFVGISLLVCALCMGMFLLGGGMPGQEKPDAGQDTRPLPQP